MIEADALSLRSRARAPVDAAAPPSAWIGRLEYFGCLLYDPTHSDYIPFDAQATKVFQLSQTLPLDKIQAHFKDTHERGQLHAFAELCQSIGILDAWGRFNGYFLTDRRHAGNTLTAPTLVRLALTNACNFRCSHCFTSAGNPYADELTTDEVQALIDELADIGCQQLSLGGGEPLVRRDLPAIVAHANQRGVRILLSTNAVAATKETVASLAGLRFDEISVSMDAADATAHDALRGEPGAFEMALRGIENLRGLGAPISFRSLLHPGDPAALDALIRLAERLAITRIVFKSMLPAGRALQRLELVPTLAQTNALWDAIAVARARTTVALEIPQQVPFKGRRLFEGFGCQCGRLDCYVDARGAVTPSGLLKDALPTGSLRHSSLRAIWQDGAAFTRLRALQGNAMCRQCSEFQSCRGGCRALAWTLAANLEQADANCRLVADAVARGEDERLAGALSLPAEAACPVREMPPPPT